jgi:glucoamylase
VGDQFSVVLHAPALVHWGSKGWNSVRDSATSDTGLGVHRVYLSLAGLTAGDTVQFTFYWLDRGAWEGQDYEVQLVDLSK